jgi:hypothetical protein
LNECWDWIGKVGGVVELGSIRPAGAIDAILDSNLFMEMDVIEMWASRSPAARLVDSLSLEHS